MLPYYGNRFLLHISTSSHGDSSSRVTNKTVQRCKHMKHILYDQEPLGDKVKCHSLSICGDITRSFKKCHLLLHTCWSTSICPHRSDIFEFILNIVRYFKVIDILYFMSSSSNDVTNFCYFYAAQETA